MNNVRAGERPIRAIGAALCLLLIPTGYLKAATPRTVFLYEGSEDASAIYGFQLNPETGAPTPVSTATPQPGVAWAADGSQQNLTDLVTWSSSVPAVATVSSSGLATTLEGTTVISASQGSITGVTNLYVK